MSSIKTVEFASEKCLARFRRALKNVPSTARIERLGNRTTLLLRPENLLAFGHALIGQGLQNCETSNKILRRLDREKDEYIRFEHQA